MHLEHIKLTKRVNNLLKIVKKWNIKLAPEYRGFRCADCQKYIHKAYQHNLNSSGYKVLVHFCISCEKKNNGSGNYETFKCDNCERAIRKAYHIWNKNRGTLEEIHLCNQCFVKMK